MRCSVSSGVFAPPLGGAVQQADYRHQYMVSSDGQQFLVAVAMDGSTLPISLILNWKSRPQHSRQPTREAQP